MGSAIQTGECVIRVDETDDEGDSVGSPASVVDKVSEDELSILVAGGFGRDDYEYNEE